MRGVGPIGYPGGAEVVNMRPPAYLLKLGINALPCLGDGRQSGTSGSPSILNASPEAAQGGGLSLVKTGDKIRIDLTKCTANLLLSAADLSNRESTQREESLTYPNNQTPWQEIFREKVDQFSEGMTLKGATKYRDIARKHTPRDNH
jgi:dihydroxy-acid dehydratase